jgi:hypothetical protein
VFRKSRFALLVLALCALALGPASAAHADGAGPRITLLSPANGATIESAPGLQTYPTFKWHVDWPDVPAGTTVLVSWSVASDPGFTHPVGADNGSCTAPNLDCFSSIAPHAVYTGKLYWRVQVTAAGVQVASETWSFTAVKPADRDGDGVFDRDDNCPGTKNADQLDSNHDGKGDACQADRARPRVAVLAGGARRGSTGYFYARIGDDRGYARITAVLKYHGMTVMSGSMPLQPVNWLQTVRFYTQHPIPAGAPTGRYEVCVSAWDRAGNRGSSCAVYRIR